MTSTPTAIKLTQIYFPCVIFRHNYDDIQTSMYAVESRDKLSNNFCLLPKAIPHLHRCMLFLIPFL